MTGTIGNGSIVTTPLDGAGNQLNAFSGGSGVYTYRWVRSDTGSNVIYGTQANLYNIEPGTYYVTVTDAILGCEYPPVEIDLGGYDPVRLNGVETANFVNLRGANLLQVQQLLIINLLSTVTADLTELLISSQQVVRVT